ncbi:DUF58 domain-containing protein [Haloprofundus sp. MHR1]|uniref:DUF58 domain-containing protein n=1 Tax=Haloprofundus sp. MHR1 TaxID=2572921 RepID=UPI0010BEB13D|nr:DUF58 domain-containing protein [Haloprofundus sp. MHR1]QCJ47450.1 DUF58 domain-containing protein [Haloprofundus sp. MHR1]
MSAFETNRWTGVEALALLSGSLAILVSPRQPALLLAGVLGIAYAAYAYGGDAPDPSVAVERELDDSTAAPDETVRVTVTVRNVGESTLPDLRVVDGVPPALEVTDGTARLGTALRPGKRARFSYAVRAVRGEHEWEPMRIIARNASGSNERATAASTETVLRCEPRLSATENLPLRGLTTQYAGRISTDVAGAGLEFTSTREYRRGDPLKRVDWNRLARTGELATTEFREERAATVVLLVDAREGSYLAPEPDAPNAVERSAEAAGETFVALLDGGDRVGLATFAAESLWLPPGTGRDHRARGRRLLATHPSLAPTPPEDAAFFPSIRLRRLQRRLPADAQVILFSPLVDDYVVTAARRLDAHGHLVTVVSPDPTADETPGRRLARVERRNRMSRLRRTGIRVIDWRDESLATELARARERWSS